MDPSAFPDPETLRRRHEALVAIEDFVGLSDDGFRSFGAASPSVFWFSSGGGDEYQLVLVGADALLWAFDHESSQYGEPDRPEWPGMFDGMPAHLRARLPGRADDEPLYVSACFWFTDGAWHAGDPEPVPQDDEYDEYDDDPGGARWLLEPLLDPEAGLQQLIEDHPDRVDEARRLQQSILDGS